MPDDRYRDGDPTMPAVIMLDTGEFLAGVHQELKLIADLIEAGRHPEAIECALSYRRRAERLLRTLEKPPLPEVDIDRTPDVTKAGKRVYKAGRQAEPGSGTESEGA